MFQMFCVCVLDNGFCDNYIWTLGTGLRTVSQTLSLDQWEQKMHVKNLTDWKN